MKIRLLSAVAALAMMSSGLQTAKATLTDEDLDLSEFSHVDPGHRVPNKALARALVYFKRNRNHFDNQSNIAVIDYTKHSSQPRFYIVNVRSGAVEAHLTSHGLGSDRNNTGYAHRFSNSPRSEASSVGFFKTGEVYSGRHGRSLRLIGLSSTNSNALSRAVVIHGAWYVNDQGHTAGRSWGCPAVDPRQHARIIGKLQGGAMIYAWAGQ